jgi:type III restriction enzyme
MLKEGWDVTNLYTIVPLRAANARTLIEQSIGRGLRLPYGRRTGVTAVDRLNIVAHDRFQEIVDEARRPDSPIRLQAVVLDPDQLGTKSATLVVQSRLETMLGVQPGQASVGTILARPTDPPLFPDKEDQAVAQLTLMAIARLADHPEDLPSASWLERPEIRASLAVEIEAEYQPVQMALDGVGVRPDISAVVSKVAETVARQTIDIPRILVVPRTEVKSGFKPFVLKLDGLKYPPVAEKLWAQYLRTNEGETLAVGQGGMSVRRSQSSSRKLPSKTRRRPPGGEGRALLFSCRRWLNPGILARERCSQLQGRHWIGEITGSAILHHDFPSTAHSRSASWDCRVSR